MKAEECRPSGWTTIDLGEVASIDVGGTPSTEVRAFWGGGIPWMASGDVHLRRIADVPGRISEEGLAGSNAKLIEPPAVAVALAGQGKTRGTVALTECPLSCNQSVALIKGSTNALSTSYLFHELENRYEELRARSSGGGRGGLSIAILSRVPMNLPPLPDQKVISYILDMADAAIRSTERIIAKLHLAREGLLSELLTRGAWRELRIGDFTHVTVGYVGPIAHYFTKSSDGVPLLSTTNIANSRIRPHGIRRVTRAFDRTNIKSRLAVDDIIVARHGDSGESAVIPPSLSGAQCLNVVIIKRSPEVYSDFLARLLSSAMVRRRILATKAGSVQGVVNTSEIERLVVQIPPIAEQQSILERVNAGEQRLLLESQNWAKLRLLKQGLMDDLLTGRVRLGASA